MIRLYHCPNTRSSRILWLLEEMGVREKVEVVRVSVQRSDGSGSADPRNPHPEGKVPLLEHDGVLLRESSAIMLYLTDLFPEGGLGVQVGDPQRGAYLNWLHYYSGVMEPVLTVQFSSMTPDALFTSTFRGPEEMAATLTSQLAKTPYLLGDSFSAADVLIVAPFMWFPAMAPESQPVREWIARCAERPACQKITAQDQEPRHREG